MVSQEDIQIIGIFIAIIIIALKICNTIIPSEEMLDKYFGYLKT